MTRKRWIAANLIAMGLFLGLAGCSDASGVSDAGKPDATAITVPLPDGRTVICVAWDPPSYTGGISCDWEHAK